MSNSSSGRLSSDGILGEFRSRKFYVVLCYSHLGKLKIEERCKVDRGDK